MVKKLNRKDIFEREELESNIKDAVDRSLELIRMHKHAQEAMKGVWNLLGGVREKRLSENGLSREIAHIAYQNFYNLPACEKGYIDFIWSLNAKREKIGKRLTKRIINESINMIDANKTALKKLLRSEAKRKIYREKEDEGL